MTSANDAHIMFSVIPGCLFLSSSLFLPSILFNSVIFIYRYPLFSIITIHGKDFGRDSAEALAEYTNFVFPYLIKRGSYPLYSGTAILDSMEKWGIENAEEWTSGALVRYRSRRVMLEMATDSTFEQFHDAKIAAIEKTFAFPTTADISMGNLSLTVFFILLSLSLGMQLLINRKRRE